MWVFFLFWSPKSKSSGDDALFLYMHAWCVLLLLIKNSLELSSTVQYILSTTTFSLAQFVNFSPDNVPIFDVFTKWGKSSVFFYYSTNLRALYITARSFKTGRSLRASQSILLNMLFKNKTKGYINWKRAVYMQLFPKITLQLQIPRL